jgi:hypothetical protein
VAFNASAFRYKNSVVLFQLRGCFRQAGVHYVVAVILVVPKSGRWWVLGGKSLEEPVSETDFNPELHVLVIRAANNCYNCYP